MSWGQYYAVIGGCIACYTLGLMHARGRNGVRNVAVSLLCGALWPLMLVYGFLLTHFNVGEK